MPAMGENIVGREEQWSQNGTLWNAIYAAFVL